jgi:hypothetical protein
MLRFILDLLGAVRIFFLTRTDGMLEVLALRQQVAVLKRKRPHPKLNPMDRLFWTALRTVWSRWAEVLLIVKPETVALDSVCTGVGALAGQLVAGPQSRRKSANSSSGWRERIPRGARPRSMVSF